MAVFDMRISWPQGELDPEGVMLGAEVTMAAEDLGPEDVIMVLLTAAEGVVYTEVKRRIMEDQPYLTGDLVEPLAVLNTRLSLVDRIVHMNSPTFEGGVTVI